MPGISLVRDISEGLFQNEIGFSQSLDAFLYSHHFKKTIILNGPLYFLGSTAYKGYPSLLLNSKEFTIYIDGQIYGKDQSSISKELFVLANHIFQHDRKSDEYLENWLLSTDGDFLVTILHKPTNRLCVFNDALGRLPAYYYQDGGRFFLSREIRFLVQHIPNRDFDRMAIAQYLIFGFPLGSKTLLKDVYRLPPSTLIRIDSYSNAISITQCHKFNLDSKNNTDNTISHNAKILTELFQEACANRTQKKYPTVLSLSGGLDSRAVAASVAKLNISISSVTRLNFDRANSNDARIAEDVAKALNLNWELFHIDPPRGKDLIKLLQIKGGLNFLGMSFILPFLEKVQSIYGTEIRYLTGDGGDKVLRDLRPTRHLLTLEKSVNYLLEYNQVFSVTEAAALTGISEGELLEEIGREISAYPETEFDQKYIHFMIFERAFKWLFEGEDRNRYFFWSATPFYAIKFFNYAMGCSDTQKADFHLYQEFLLQLSPEVSAMENATWGLGGTTRKNWLKHFLRSVVSMISPNVKRRLKNFQRPPETGQYVECIRNQTKNGSSINRYLSVNALNRIIGGCGKWEALTLLTLTSLFEEFDAENSILEEYFEYSFGEKR